MSTDVMFKLFIDFLSNHTGFEFDQHDIDHHHQAVIAGKSFSCPADVDNFVDKLLTFYDFEKEKEMALLLQALCAGGYLQLIQQGNMMVVQHC